MARSPSWLILIVMRSLGTFCVLLSLLLCSGCAALPSRYRAVTLSFPDTEKAKNAEVQEAILLIDQVLVARGYARVAKPPEARFPGFVCCYSSQRDGRAYLGDPYVWLRNGKLRVIFREGDVYSYVVREAVRILDEELRSHYGKDRVEVTHEKV